MTPFQSNRLPEPIYDFAWYPYMQRMDPSSSVYVVSMPHQPIQLYDTSSTTLRCSYVYENHVERIVGPTCVRFSNDGTRLLGGMKGSLVLFDVHRPGKTPLAVISTTRRCSSSNVDLGSSPHFSQRGIFSSLAYNDPYQCIAVASYSKTIGLYDFHAQGLCRIPCTTAPTYVTWDASGTYLVASHRHGTGHVTVYDVRMPKTCVWKYVRGFGTQQKTRVQVVGSLVVMAACGDQGRWVHGTDLFTGTHTGSLLQEPSTVTSTVLRDEWFLSCSGKRHFHPPSMELESLDLNVQEGTVSSSVDLHPPSSTMHCFNDSSLKVWKVPGEYTTWSSDSEHEPSMLMQCA
ncbi:hypothetical protein HMI54_014520 [Coelomomyces lativittatus]|nr:hypothetical protein HMI54_014520 [Coelomomyces lativittatus]